MRHRNPFATRRAPSARAIRRANALSPRQQTRVLRRLKANADRLIQQGLAERLAQVAEDAQTVA